MDKTDLIMISNDIRRRLRNIESVSKDDNIPLNLLCEALTHFLIDVNYTRTPYELYMPMVYRARTKKFESIEEACQYFDHQDKFSYPDAKKVNLGWGRCSGPNEAVFYCGDENVIPIFEVRPKSGEYLVLASYRHLFEDTIKLTLPVIGVKQIVSSLSQREEANSLAKILSDDMHYSKAVSDEVLAIDQYFADWFTQIVDISCEHYYKLTIAFYQVFTKHVSWGVERNRFDGLMYPSVAGEITGVNIALETKFVDKNLKLLNALIYKVEQSDLIAKRFELQPIMQIETIYKNGGIKWTYSPMIGRRLNFEPSTPTLHLTPPVGFLSGIDVYEI